MQLYVLGGVAIVQMVTVVLLVYLKGLIAAAATNIAKVEIATNSMKDALVKATGEASFAAGERAGEKSQLHAASGTPVSVSDSAVAKSTEKGAEAAVQTAKATTKLAEAVVAATKKKD